MTTLVVSSAGRTHNLQDLVFMVQRKVFGTGVVSGLCACVFLQMLLDLPHERTWKMGPIKHMKEFDPIFFQETFRFSQGEFTEILSSMRDLDGDLLVDGNGDPRLLRRIGKTRQDYMRCCVTVAQTQLTARTKAPRPHPPPTRHGARVAPSSRANDSAVSFVPSFFLGDVVGRAGWFSCRIVPYFHAHGAPCLGQVRTISRQISHLEIIL
jgi:hypothetical protein